MLIVKMEVAAPLGAAIGVKEAIAMDMEKYGDVRVVSVEEVVPEQLRIRTDPERKCANCGRFERDAAASDTTVFRRGVCHRGGQLAPVYDVSAVCPDWAPK